LPGLSVVTFLPAFLSVIVKPGPVVPESLVALRAVNAVGGAASARTTKSGRNRRIESTPYFETLGVLRESSVDWMARSG
jgi:hypothetical protein